MADTDHIPLFFMALGISILVFGFVSRRNGIRYSRCTVPCDAEVVAVRCDRGSDTDLYLPTFRHTVDGVPFTSETGFGSSDENHYLVGDVYRMYYDPDNPLVICRRGMNRTRRWPCLLIAAGALIFAAGMAYLAVTI